MRSFFKMFFAALLAFLVLTVVVVLIFFGLIAGLTTPDKPDVGHNGVLVVDLTKHYKEQAEDNPLNSLTSNADKNVPGLYDVIRLIHHAKGDSAIKGIYVKCDENANGFAASQELRDALLDFKKTNKFVIAFGDMLTQKAYYVATAADKVYCNPKGIVEWTGLGTTLMFFKGLLDKLQIEPQIFYAGKFKSATEPFRAYKMTDPNKLQVSVYLGDLYSQLLQAAALKSGNDTALLHQLANTGAIQTASDAVHYRLVDALKYDDEVKSEIIDHLKTDATKPINFITLGKYAKAVDLYTSSDNKIALIYAEGEITEGQEKADMIASDYYKNLIRKARLDKNIKAIVLRVNSPGGSALASEEIWREVTLARKAKPVVVSFGDVAASGGYYISCNADSIFAQPNTITGSIGVFGIIPNMEKFFNSKLGITFDGVKTGPFADLPTATRAMTDAEKRFMQNTIDTIYTTFKDRVAQGRKLSSQVVDSIAQGRVWTGKRAVELGLADRLGSIDDGIKCAARMAGIKEYALREYPLKKSFLEKLFQSPVDDVKRSAIKDEIGEEQYTLLLQLKRVRAMFNTPQARLPFELNIQ